MMTEYMPTFQEVVRARYSCRGFKPDPVPSELMMQVLEEAQLAPSNCNTQPWSVHIVSGAKLAELSTLLHQKNQEQVYTPDFTFDLNDYGGVYQERQKAQGKAYYEGLGIARDDVEGRRRAEGYNFSFFNAPHVALLFMPPFGDCVRAAGDIGMYGQTFLLSLAARGLAGIPQTSLGFFADTIREFLGITGNHKMLFGISFGYPDDQAAGCHIDMGRVPIGDSVTFHE
ncbi:MAG: nitroreductase [Alcaligenaceae bacterium]|nr:nitroreductase [Alcaligenaceae bacterium]